MRRISSRSLGYDPHDIRRILHSRGHYDHIGMTRASVEMTGAKNYTGAPDRDYVNGKLDLTWAKELGARYDEPFKPDVLLHDGDILHFDCCAEECCCSIVSVQMRFLFPVFQKHL